jgi:hypothetical protein
MERKNKRMLVIIGVLLVANLVFFFGGNMTKGVSYDDAQFSVQDTSAVTSIQIGDIFLKREGAWMVGNYPADPAFVDHLLNVMLRVRVKKPVGAMVSEGAMEMVINDKLKFQFVPNDTKTRTYFISEGEGYEMEIPGFSDYVGGIFELEADQWRDRLVYDGSWRTIQLLELDYTANDADDFTIRFEKDFFTIPGVTKLDTANMMNYLNQFQFFQANERMSPGRVPYLDSLAKTTPMAILRIDDIQIKEPITFTIFPRRPQDGFHLMLDPAGEMIAVDVQRAGNILFSKRDFSSGN